MLLKVYNNKFKNCFEQEQKVLLKIKEKNFQTSGFSCIKSSTSYGDQSEILMELLGPNL